MSISLKSTIKLIFLLICLAIPKSSHAFSNETEENEIAFVVRSTLTEINSVHEHKNLNEQLQSLSLCIYMNTSNSLTSDIYVKFDTFYQCYMKKNENHSKSISSAADLQDTKDQLFQQALDFDCENDNLSEVKDFMLRNQNKVSSQNPYLRNISTLQFKTIYTKFFNIKNRLKKITAQQKLWHSDTQSAVGNFHSPTNIVSEENSKIETIINILTGIPYENYETYENISFFNGKFYIKIHELFLEFKQNYRNALNFDSSKKRNSLTLKNFTENKIEDKFKKAYLLSFNIDKKYKINQDYIHINNIDILYDQDIINQYINNINKYFILKIGAIKKHFESMALSNSYLF